MVPIMGKDKLEDKNVVTTANSVNSSNVVSSKNSTNEYDEFGDDVKSVTVGEFGKFVRLQESLENQIERRNLKHQPGMSFGERLGTKIEEKISDNFLDKMMNSMFNVGGVPAKQDGWLAIVKTILDSGFAQQAGAKLPETIEALTKRIGPQKTDELADAVIQAVNPNKTKSIGPSPEDEQKKMEKFVLGLNPVNILDIKKFMDLVNANPSNNKVTDQTQARNTLIEEQNRIRRENPVLANEIAILNQDKDTGMGSVSPFGNSIDRLPGDMMGNMMSRNQGSTQTNQLGTEQILALDPNNDISVESYAWSNGYGNMLSEPNGLQKVRNILMRTQDELTKQLSGLGGAVGSGQEQEQSVEGELAQGDFGWDEEDVGKKGVGKGRRIDDKDVIVPPGVAATKADSPVDNNKENVTQNAMMELLQKMAHTFDSGMIEINQKLQAVESRVAKVETVSGKVEKKVEEKVADDIVPESVPISDITISEENVRTTMDMEFEEEEEEEEDNLEDTEKETEKEIIQEAEIVSETKEEVKENKIEENTKETIKESQVHVKAPNSVIDESKDVLKETKPYAKGTQGWLKEQKNKNKR